MARYRIEFDREECIGARACSAVAPDFWKDSDDGKVDLADARFNKETGRYELIVEDADLEINEEAAQLCPVDVITITKLED